MTIKTEAKTAKCPGCGETVTPRECKAETFEDLVEFGAANLWECPECGYIDETPEVGSSWGRP